MKNETEPKFQNISIDCRLHLYVNLLSSWLLYKNVKITI